MDQISRVIPFHEKHMMDLIALVNSAYRGEASKKGWTTEADIIAGDIRIDRSSLNSMLQAKGGTILTCFYEERLAGCVYLKEEKEGLYLGLLSVAPHLQGKGIGKKLLEAAETYAAAHQYTYIIMTVIDIRKELINWYEGHGYYLTGETKPFPVDERFGRPVLPLQFAVLKKMISEPG